MFGLTDILIYLPLIVLVWVPLGFYYYSMHSTSYWKRKNVPFAPAKPIVGNLLECLLFRKSVAQVFSDIYSYPKFISKSCVGMYLFHKPTLLVRDPELVKQILVKDFASFSNRHTASDTHSDIVGSYNLFFILNPTWKILRARLTPFFTSGKMRQMFHLMKNIGNELNDMMLSQKLYEKSETNSVEIKDIFARYTTDVIASCAFGVEANSLKNPDSDFRKNGRKIFEFDWYRSMEFFSVFLLPEVVPFFKFKVFSQDSTKFIRDSINHIIGEREKSKAVRNDLIDTLISLKKEDKSEHLSATNVAEISYDPYPCNLFSVFQGDVIVAQAAIFFTAGYETSSTALSFGMYELAFQPDIQKRLREEIRETLQESKNELTYDNVNGMVYLNMIVQEMMRMYPPVPFLDRKCTESKGYSLKPFEDCVIPNDTPIMIPVFSIQRDPKYWPNPEKFDPERFSPQNKDHIVPYTFLALGVGPRSCIGERFGILQMKVGLINFFKNHLVRPTENTPTVLKFEPRALFLQSVGGIYLEVVRDPIILN
ncbi:putative cytochrome P450 6g2 [Pseudolycoriella hygida]|uniref:Cytochrome P450 6g2 n=1 Tax=Pseudolycoriella hygida TaxID=35572 RepID=A0A9Q0S2S1_9DIPT|nr:putative cytochrome P450 6g2 [Pseudolycoriella hygida]